MAQAGPHVDSKTDTVVTEAQSPGKDALDQIAAYQVSDLFFYVRGKGSNKRESEPTSPSVLSVTHLFRAFPVPSRIRAEIAAQPVLGGRSRGHRREDQRGEPVEDQGRGRRRGGRRLRRVAAV